MEKQRFFPIGFISLIVAALLLSLGTFFKSHIDNYQVTLMIVCVGLGLILGAFGSVATLKIRTQGIAVAGSAALSLIYFTYLSENIKPKYLTVEISINQKNKSIENMHFYGDDEYPVSRLRDGKLFKFIISEPSIDTNLLSLQISNTDQEDPLPLDCIKSSFFRPLLSSGKTITLHYDETDEILFEKESHKVLSGTGGCEIQKNIAVKEYKTNDKILSALKFSLFNKANAQTTSLKSQNNTETQSQNSTEELIKSLDSDNTFERRAARTKLAEQGETSAKQLIETFVDENRNSARNRVKIGTLVALVEMSRKKEAAEKVSSIVNENFIDQLVNSVNDEDKTIRLYSTELLSLIDYPNATQKAIDKFEKASLDGKYNYALLIRNKAQTLPENEKQLLTLEAEKLKSETTPKINEIINQISESSKN